MDIGNVPQKAHCWQTATTPEEIPEEQNAARVEVSPPFHHRMDNARKLRFRKTTYSIPPDILGK